MSENGALPLIVMGLAGEGRGHATRALTIINSLGSTYRYHIFTSHDAYQFLEPLAAKMPTVTLEQIPGLKFFYKNGKLAFWHSVGKGFVYLAGLRSRAKNLADRFRSDPPALVISDFESTSSWASWFAQVPLVSLDHQHFLVAYDLSCLPWWLRAYGAGMALVVRAHHTWQQKTIVTGFFREQLRPAYRDAIAVGPMIRQTVLDQTATTGNYTLSYLRPKAARRILDIFQSIDQPMKVYGLGEQPATGKLQFYGFHPTRFVEHLAGAKAVVGAAGNQLIGEALFLGKPYYGLPESRHHEQLMNGCFIKRMGVGDASALERLKPCMLRQFFANLETYRANIQSHRDFLNGTPKAIATLKEELAKIGAGSSAPARSLDVA